VSQATQHRAKDLGDYRALLRRRWMWVIVGLVTGVVAGLLYLQAKTPTYVSTAEVKLEATAADTALEDSRTPGAVNLDTEAQLVKSTAVASDVADKINSTATPAALARRVTVTVPANTTVLTIAFEASTAKSAQAGAQAFAHAYLANRTRLAEELIKAKSDHLEKQIDDVNALLFANLKRFNDNALDLTPGDLAILKAEQLQYSGQLRRLQANLDPLQNTVVRPGQVIVEAQVPTKIEKPNRQLVLASTVMAGLLLGLALASLRDRADRRIHSAAEVERLYGLAVLGELDLRKVNLENVGADSPRASQLRALAMAIQASVPGESMVALVQPVSDVTMSRDVAREIATGAASTGSRTVLLTRKSVFKSAAEAVSRRGDDADVRLSSYEQLKLVGQHGVASSAVPEALGRVSDETDFVVLDALTGEPTVDLPMLARHVDIVVVVIEIGRTTQERLATLMTLSHRAGARAMCAVAVKRGRADKRSAPRDHIWARDRKSQDGFPKTTDDDSTDSGRSRGPVVPG
jgi:capsular polysaccharide biosynthesis protein